MAEVAPSASTSPVSRRRPAVAMILSFIWPGLGHLYVGQHTGTGVAFIVANAVGPTLMLADARYGVLSFLVWLPTALYTMRDSARLARQRNTELGLDH